MNLKESYRYANFLDTLITKSICLLNSDNFITVKEQTHLKQKANPNADNEVVVVPKVSTIEANTMNVIDFAMVVFAEREALHNAIAEAKKKMEINMDAALSANKRKHDFISTLQYLSGLKSTERQISGNDYMLNAENNQVKYFYTINEVMTIDFNRNQVKGLMKRLLKETDETSNKLDALEITTEIDFIPIFDVNDTFEDLVEAYVKSLEETKN